MFSVLSAVIFSTISSYIAFVSSYFITVPVSLESIAYSSQIFLVSRFNSSSASTCKSFSVFFKSTVQRENTPGPILANPPASSIIFLCSSFNTVCKLTQIAHPSLFVNLVLTRAEPNPYLPFCLPSFLCKLNISCALTASSRVIPFPFIDTIRDFVAWSRWNLIMVLSNGIPILTKTSYRLSISSLN